MDSTPVTLQKAYQLIKEGHKQQAIDLLTPLVYGEPNNVQAWYLLGFAHTDRDQRIRAFEQVLRLDPANQPAQKQLDKLRAASPVEPVLRDSTEVKVSLEQNAREATAEMSVTLRWVLGIGGGVVLCLVLVTFGFWWTLQGSRTAPAAESVSATSGTVSDSTQTATPPASPTFGPHLTSTPRASVTPYKRRATFTPLPGASESAEVSLNAVFTASALKLTSAVPAPTVVATPNMDIFTDTKVTWKDSAVTDTRRGHLKADETAILNFDLDSPAQVTFVLGTTAKNAPVLTLTDPNGLLIDAAYIKAHPQETLYVNGPFGLPAIQLNYPAVGTWKISLTADEESDYQVYAWYGDAALQLGAIVDKAQYVAGDFVTIAARLEDKGVGLAGATVTALIALPDSTAQIITLKDLGNGHYARTYILGELSGPITIDILAKGSNHGVSFERSASIQASVVSPDIKLNGHYAARLETVSAGVVLNIRVGVDSGYAGTYKFTGQLMVDDRVISVAVVNVSLVQGTNDVILRFRGADFIASKQNGPYRLAWVSFSRPGIASGPQMQVEWQTPPYNWQDFNP